MDAHDHHTKPDRNLALELVRVTEAAALAAARQMGRGDKNAADRAAIAAMRHMMGSLAIDGRVVVGEGEREETPALFNGQAIGTGDRPAVDIALNAIDGAMTAAKGMNGALSAVGLAERGSIFDPGPCFYMDKIAVGEDAVEVVDLDASATENLKRIADAKRATVSDLTVVILDRERHARMVEEIRNAGARIRFIIEGDLTGAIAAARQDTGVDVLLGTGGAQQGVLAACALKCLGGAIQARLRPRTDDERARAEAAGYDLDRLLKTEDLVSGNDVFFAATGITDGDLLRGVRYRGDSAATQSLVMRSRSGTVRVIDSLNRRAKLKRFSAIEY